MDPRPPMPPFPWVKIVLSCTLIGILGAVASHYLEAPVNRTLEVNASSTEVPGSTTVTLQLHQDGSVTWQRPPTMDDRVWFLPKLGIQSIDAHTPHSTPIPPPPSPWVEETLKTLNEKYDPNK